MSISKHSIAQDLRCFSCGKLLARNDIGKSHLEVKCNRCGSLNSVFKYIKDQVILTDAEGIILYANTLLQEVTGYSLDEVVGKTPGVWGGQMSAETYIEMWDRLKKEKKPVVMQVTNKKKDGTLYEAMLRISPVFDTKGNIQMFVGMETVISKDNNENDFI